MKIEEGPDGYLYYANLFSEEGSGDGAIHRIAYRPDSPTARLEADTAVGLYDGSGDFETELDAERIVRSQRRTRSPTNGTSNEDGIFETTGGETRTLTYTEAEQDEREGEGEEPEPGDRGAGRRRRRAQPASPASPSTPATNRRCRRSTNPPPASEWGVGDEIKLGGDAIDADGNPIVTPLPYYWITRMAHCPDPANPTACHVHPLQTFSGIRSAGIRRAPARLPDLHRSDPAGLRRTRPLRYRPR